MIADHENEKFFFSRDHINWETCDESEPNLISIKDCIFVNIVSLILINFSYLSFLLLSLYLNETVKPVTTFTITDPLYPSIFHNNSQVHDASF